MLIALLVGILLAVIVFFVIKLGSGAYIGYQYTSEESRAGRENGYAVELQKYVDDRGLSSADVSQLADWARGHRYLYVMVHKDDELLFEWGAQDNNDGKPDDGTEDSPGKGEDIFPDTGLIPERPTKEELIAYAKEKDAYPIIMADETAVLVSMADYTEYWYYDLFNVTSLVAAMLALVLAVMLYIGRVTGRISNLAREVAAVADGDMEHSIHIDGTDEIGQLSGDVEDMRSSILEKMERERKAVESNTELITSMSHDIRTPLTVLLGYLDIMKRKNDDPNMGEYIEASQKTALRLKKISDDLFNYFLVFGGGGAAQAYCDVKKFCELHGIECVLAEDEIGSAGLMQLCELTQTKIGTMLSEIPFSNIPIIFKNCGLDFLIVDTEHGAFDYTPLSSLITTARLVGLTAIVRLSDGERRDITRLADMGADGFILPMTNSAEDIQKVVEYAKYAPIGNRGISTNRAHTFYNPPPMSTYMRAANERIKVFAQIETKSGVENIDGILSTEGVDGVFVGPNDLSISLGCVGCDEPIKQAISTVADSAKRHGKPWGIITTSSTLIAHSLSCDTSFISYGSEINMIKDSCNSIRRKIYVRENND